MSNIQTLIETVKEENLNNREIYVDLEANQFQMMINQFDMLDVIQSTISHLRDGFYQYMDEERQRFLEQQADFDAARRAEAERLKEAGARGFTTPAKTSSGEVAETPTQDGGLLGGLGIAGLVAGLGAAVAGYFAGLTTALAKGLASVTKSITALFKIDNLLPDRKTLTAPFSNFFKGIKEFGKAFSALVKADDMNLFYDAQQKFGRLSGVATRVAGFVDRLIKFFSPLGEVTKLLPSGGKFLEGIKAFGSKLGGIFKVFSKIAVPITAIIATVKSLFASAEEFDENTTMLDKIFIIAKNFVKEMISAFVTGFADLIKSAVSWIAGALGFTEIEKKLDSFSFDEMFRNAFDWFFETIGEMVDRFKLMVYEIRKSLPEFLGGISDDELDPEMEAQITQKNVKSAEKELEVADERLARITALVQANPENAGYQKALELAQQDRQLKEENLQKAKAAQVESQQTIASNQRAALQEVSVPERDLKYTYPVLDPVSGEVLQSFNSPEEAATAAMQINGVIGQPQLVQSTSTQQVSPSTTNQSDVSSMTTASSNQSEVLQSLSTTNQPIDQSSITTASSNQSDVSVVNQLASSNVEALSNFSNVESLASASTIISRLAAGESTDSPLGVFSAILSQGVESSKGLTSLPVNQASREVAAAQSAPSVSVVNANKGGDTFQTTNNNLSQTVMGGGASARSGDLPHQRRMDNMQSAV